MKINYTIKELTEKAERDHIIHILNVSHWRIGEAARLMQINRSTLFRKMQKYGITRNCTDADTDERR